MLFVHHLFSISSICIIFLLKLFVHHLLLHKAMAVVGLPKGQQEHRDDVSKGHSSSKGPSAQEIEEIDPSDRAEGHKKPGLYRVPLDEIGFWPGNRNGNGINPYHVHRVAHDIMTQKFRSTRCQGLSLVEIPDRCLGEIRMANQLQCDSDDLLPAFSSKIRYVCATKTHCIHGLKLCVQKSHKLYNDPDAPLIQFRKDDLESVEIAGQGVLAYVYRDTLFDDLTAFEALVEDGNLNSAIENGMDEMQAFGRVDILMSRMSEKERWKGKKPTDAEVLKEVEKIGFGKFPVEDWMNLIQLRCCLEPELAKVLRTCQFEACASRVRVRPGDFALVSELHADVPWVKVAILLQKYIGTLHEKFPTVEKGGKKRPCIAFTERETEVAQKLSITCMAQLRQEVQLQKAIENRYICDLRVGEPPHRLRPVTLH